MYSRRQVCASWKGEIFVRTRFASGFGGSFSVGLNQPFACASDPYGGGVVVEVGWVGVVFGAADEGVDYVVGGDGGVWREDADLEVAEFVGCQLALFEGDEEGVERG